MAEEFEVYRVDSLPIVSSVSDNDSLLIVQGGRPKRVPPSLMKGPKGDSIKGDKGDSAFVDWKKQSGNESKTYADYQAWLRQPATDAGIEVRKDMTQISQDVNQLKTETIKAKNDAIEATDNANTATSDLEELKEVVTRASYLAEEKAGEAETQAAEAERQAAEAKYQADYAKEEGDKAAGLTTRIDLLEIGKADNLLEEDGKFYLTSGGVVISDGIEFGKGGGGSGSGGVTMKVKNLVSSLLSVIQGQELQIGYNFTSVYTDDNTPTGTGTAVYTVNSQKVATITVNQGDNYFEVSKYLTVGTNKMSVKVSDSTGASRSLTYVIDVISLSISDSYDPVLVNTKAIVYRYIPVGAVEKTIHFILDGKEIGKEVTTISNRQQTYTIPVQAHGAHRLEVYMTTLVNETEVRSNTLTHDLICVEPENNTVIIASAFNQTSAKQYDKLAIPFIVYNPALSTSQVTLSVNDAILSEQTVDRTLQTWNYRLNQAGNVILKITCGEVSKSFALTVSEAETIVEAETADLELYLTSQNRSNNDNNKAEWKYNGIAAALVNFNYRTDGWITTDGSTALRVSGDARVTVPFNIFASDFRATGKTIEFEFATRDVIDYDATVISSLSGNIGLKVTAQQALFKSEQTSVDTRFKEDERVRVAFVIEKRTDYRLVYIYINGIMSGVAQYPADDNFQQAVPVGITIGSSDCAVDIYNIRIYHNNLTQYQVLDNYMADMDDYDRKMEVYERNQVFDEYGNISYQKVVTQIPCMILEGPLPTFKGDKKTNKVFFTSLQEPARDFSCENIQNDVQGTSSQYYPRKNFKFKFKTTITYTESGEPNANYALRSDSIPVNCFCIKADFAESSGTHNTGLAKVIEELLKSMKILTPPQKTNTQVRTTVDGYPICLFHRETPDAELTFVGKYNFNNDKSTETTFGFSDGDESWEFLNNTSDRSLFKSADFSTDDWQNDFEARYPDGSLDKTNLQSVMEWVVSTIGNVAKFKAEASDHFDLRNLLSYYLITELFGMVDQRAKNMFLTWFAADGKWRFIFYDNDTCNGINNEGLIAFGYGIEYHDREGTLNVFNGEQSVLWNNVEAAFASELADMYREMRTHLSYTSVASVLNGEQSDKWCEAIYNADGRYKYINPLIEEGNGSYLYAAQGSREEHRKWWLYSRFLYMDSKYNAADFLTDYATMRLYTPQVWAGVEPNADFTITPFADQYVRVKYGSYVLAERCKKDVPVTISAPAIQFNDTETIVYGASRIKSLGDLSGKYAGTIDMSKAVRLSELHIGCDVEGYHNDNLTVLSVGSNRMLRKLDIQNCPNLKQPIDVSGCENIKELYAKGTSVTTAVFAPAGILKKLQLPGTVANLTLKNQSKLTDENFTLAGVNSLTTIVLENVVLNAFTLLLRSMESGVLQRIRMINVSGSAETADILYQIADIGGIDENGYNIDRAVLTGSFHVTTIREDKFAELGELFPELTITYDTLTLLPAMTLSFVSSLNKPLLITKFVCSLYSQKIDNTTFVVKGEINETFTFTFSALNHEDVTGEVTITQQEETKQYSTTYILMRTIRILKRNTTIFIPNATVKIGDETYTASAAGQVQIRKNVSLNGTVEATDYNDSEFSFDAIVDDTINTVYLDPQVIVTFTVCDDKNNLLNGATITVGGKSANTNSSRVCTIALKQGKYNYTAKYNNYMGKGEVTVGLSNISVSASVLLDISTMNPEENGNIQLLLSGTAAALSITSTTTDYMINWGDDTTENASGTGARAYNHTYPDDGYYQVEISNCAEVTLCSGNSICTIAYWSIGDSKVADLSFYYFENIEYIGDLWKNDTKRTSLNQFCYNCVRLKQIDLSSFVNNHSVTNLAGFLQRCNNLTSINLAPLAGMVEVTRLSEFLSGCSGLITIDLTPLSGMVGVTNLERFLTGCTGLTSIDLIPLMGMVGATDLSGFLRSCSSLTTIDLAPLTDMVKVASLNSFLSDCRGIVSIDLAPLAGMIAVTSLSYFLNYCDKLTAIDLTPLSGMTKVKNLSYFLRTCSGLISIDLTPLAGMIGVTDLANFMQDSRGLTSIDLTPLAGMTGVTGMSYFFSNCKDIFSIILGWPTPPTASISVLENSGSCPIYVPDESVELYKTATNWNRYQDRYKPISEKSAV